MPKSISPTSSPLFKMMGDMSKKKMSLGEMYHNWKMYNDQPGDIRLDSAEELRRKKRASSKR